MPPVALECSLLESREVPAATMFADIMAGVWGSYPQYITPSGNTLFFSADNAHGYELYATDGTAGSVHMVKDIKPGVGGSNPTTIISAGNGVIFFSADDGTGRTLWKSDGTAAGTVKVTGVPDAILSVGGQYTAGSNPIQANGGDWIGWKGELYLLTRDINTDEIDWVKTNGSGFTKLTDFNGTAGPSSLVTPAMQVKGDKLELKWPDKSGKPMVWQTDGTVAGTTAQQTNLTATSPTTGDVVLTIGVQIAPGQFMFAGFSGGGGSKTSLWVGDGTNPAGRTLVKAFDATPYTLGIDGLTAVNGKVFFNVGSGSWPKPADVGLWITDGTAAGTHKVEPLAGNTKPVQVVGVFDGKAVLSEFDANNRITYILTSDGTDAGSIPIPRSAGPETATWVFTGQIPPDAANPKGALLFQNVSGKVYRTDGTAAGTALIDTTGLPALPIIAGPIQEWSGNGWPVAVSSKEPYAQYGVNRGAYFNGSVFYSGKTDVQRAELWKWDLNAGTTTPPTSPAPTVTNTKVNDGSVQRSMVKTLKITFDSAVNVAATGVTITDAGGKSVVFSQQTSTVSGVTTLTLTFPSGVGGSIADGRYTLKIAASAVTRQTGGTAMASDYTFGFTRLYGDVTGDGIYDRDVRMLVKSLLGQHEGDAGYRSDLDVNSDGKIDATDELAAIRNWGKAV